MPTYFNRLSLLALSFFSALPACAPELTVSSSSSSGGTAGSGGTGGESSSTSSTSSASSSNGSSSSSTSTSSGSSLGKIGDVCFADPDCESAICADGVCCSQTCNLPCTSCNQPGLLGACLPLPVGTDECATPGELCDGTAQCACGVAKPPTGVDCPMPWENTGVAGSCILRCDTTNECRGMMLTCPAGFQCDIECSGARSCQDTKIYCPEGQRCTITCVGEDSCKYADIHCSADGPCGVKCDNPLGACPNTTIDCGNNSCVSTCSGPTQPMMTSNGSCKFTKC